MPTHLHRVRNYIDGLFAHQEQQELEDLLLPTEDEVSPSLTDISRISEDHVVSRWDLLERVTPGPNRDPARGARVAPGWLQLGLTRAELDALEARLQALLARVDRGDLPVF